MSRGKTVKYHRCSFFIIMGTRVLPYCFALFLNVLLISVWLDSLASFPTTISFNEELIVITVAALFGNIGGLALANYYPDIAVSDDGLAVSFYFSWLFVPWKDVVSVTRSFAAAGRIYLVRVRKLTIIHRLVSFSQSGSIQPGFLISPSISDYPDLLRTIREHMDEI